VPTRPEFVISHEAPGGCVRCIRSPSADGSLPSAHLRPRATNSATAPGRTVIATTIDDSVDDAPSRRNLPGAALTARAAAAVRPFVSGQMALDDLQPAIPASDIRNSDARSLDCDNRQPRRRRASTVTSEDSSQAIDMAFVIVDVDLIVDPARCRRRRGTTLSPPSTLDVDRSCAVSLDGARQRARSRSTVGSEVHVSLRCRQAQRSSQGRRQGRRHRRRLSKSASSASGTARARNLVMNHQTVMWTREVDQRVKRTVPPSRIENSRPRSARATTAMTG
jgi:hypothetical protein